MARTQKNKATEHHFGLLKAKLARYRAMLLEPTGKGKGGGDGFEVQKNGDARVALIGFPSVGKSTILSKLTETESAIAAYEFTTLTCIPGVVQYRGANIQLLDLPGIIEGASEGKGRGRQVIAVARTSDLIIMMLDASKGTVQRRLLEQELEAVGIRLNRGPPDIAFHVKPGGGLKINSVVPLTHLDNRLIAGILHEYSTRPAYTAHPHPLTRACVQRFSTPRFCSDATQPWMSSSTWWRASGRTSGASTCTTRSTRSPSRRSTSSRAPPTPSSSGTRPPSLPLSLSLPSAPSAAP